MGGFLALIQGMVSTETTNIGTGGSSKNKYIFYLKNLVGDVRQNCLSERDKSLLSELDSSQRKTLVEILSAGDPAREMFKTETGVPITVRDFLESSLGWTNDNACNALKLKEGPSYARTQPEPGLPHRKGPVHRIVMELRTINTADTLGKILGVLQRAQRQAPMLNKTPKELSLPPSSTW